MINKLVLHNIQSHKDTEVVFEKGVNSIVGVTCAGKSAVLRALHWIIENRPSGTDILCSSWNKTDTGKIKDEFSATLHTDKGWIKRYRTPDANGYLIHYADGKEVNLEAVRTDVPDEVNKFLNIGDINIQKQLDSPFLLSMSAPESARYLNSIVHLDNIDTLLSKGESDKRSVNSNIKFVSEEIEQKEKELEKYSSIDKCKSLLERIEKFDSQVVDLESEIIELQSDLHNFKDVKDYSEHLKLIDRIEKMNKSVDELDSEIRCLKSDLNEFENIKDYSKELDLIKQIESVDIPDVSDLKYSVDEYKDAQEELKELESELKELKLKLPKTCPLCGKPLEECDD